MNGPIWVGWLLVGILAILSIVLLMGKGSFLIAGYNTASKKEKERYDQKKLCRVIGTGLGIMTVIMGIDLAYEFNLPVNIQWLTPWGYLIVIAAMLLLANTISKKK
jgi:hypothetical protein